jgi:predicted MFS family arabinose efflux permease
VTESAPTTNRLPNTLLVAIAISTAPLVMQGFARFAYALVLPVMRSDLGWNYTVAGLMNTASGIGFLLGAVLAAWIGRHFGARKVYAIGWLVTGLALTATGLWRFTPALMTLRALAGFSSAVAFIAGAGLVAHLPAQGKIRPGVALGMYSSGAGAGIVVSGVVTPPILAAGGSHAWQLVWVVLGGIAVLLLALVIGTVWKVSEPSRTRPTQRAIDVARFSPTLIGHFFFGTGYIAYMTFIVAFLRSAGTGPATITAFWVAIGLSAIVGSLVWGRVLDHLRGGLGPAAVLSVTFLGSGLPVISTTTGAAIVSGIVFGSSFLACVTAVTTLARRVMPPASWMWAFGLLAAVFGIGQIIGPSLTGLISDGPGGIRAGLALSSAILLTGALTLLFQREGAGHERSPGKA